jgi:undecaprenyl pyrophosphate synthase
MHILLALSRQIPCIIAVACRILRFNLVAGVHVHMNCYSGWLGSARSMTAKTAGCSSRSWCCCWALSHQTSCLTVVAFQTLGFKVLTGVHIHLNCDSSRLGSAPSMTGTTAGGSSHSLCYCWARSHQTSCLTVVAFQTLGFHFTLGVHVHLNCYNSWLGYA